jgi:hypothetical protein
MSAPALRMLAAALFWLVTARGAEAHALAQRYDLPLPLGFFLAGAGTYYLAVSYDAVYPYSGGGSIWNLIYTSQRPPDGPGAPGPVTSWSGPPNVQPINPYSINLGGVTFCHVLPSSFVS